MPSTSNPGFVYLARVKGTAVHKIGVSSDPKRRVSEFGPPCELVHTVETGHARSIEADLLKRFSEHVTKGEWMECPETVASKIPDEMDTLKKRAAQTPTKRHETQTEAPSPTPEDLLPPLSEGDEFHFPGLQLYAHRLARKAPKTYAEIADALDVTENAVAKAVTTAGPKLQRLQMRIVELFSNYQVERQKHVEFRTWRKDKDRGK